MPAEEDRARRRAFREFVRSAHPDVGGDPADFAAGLAEFGRAASPQVPPGLTFVRRRRPLRSVVERLRVIRRDRRRRRNTRVI